MKALAGAVALVLGATTAARAEERTTEVADYRVEMVGVDLAILASAGPVIASADGHEVGAAVLYGLAYLTSGPVLHSIHGNSGRIAGSLAKRALLPLGFGAAGTMLGFAAVDDCTGERCGLGALVAGAIGTGVGVIAAVISDWTTAHVDAGPASVSPTVVADGERVSVGVTGRF